LSVRTGIIATTIFEKMKLVRFIARHLWLRRLFSCILIALLNFVILRGVPEIAVIAVPTAVLVGVFWCSAPERMVPSLLQTMIFAVIFHLTYGAARSIVAQDPRWWSTILLGVFLGISGGGAVGALIGGLARFCLADQWEKRVLRDAGEK
jgi:hypothetical protein